MNGSWASSSCKKRTNIDSTFQQYSSSLQLFSTEKKKKKKFRSRCSFSTGIHSKFPFCEFAQSHLIVVQPSSIHNIFGQSSANVLTIARATTYCSEPGSCHLHLIPLSFCTRRERGKKIPKQSLCCPLLLCIIL